MPDLPEYLLDGKAASAALADTHTASHSPLDPIHREAPLRIASRISPRLMPSHRQMISGSLVLAMACLWGVKRGFGCASRNAAVFSVRYLPSSLAQVSPGVLIPIRLKNPGAGT